MVIVFDLDNTLYDELTYVESGLRYVAEFLSQQFDINLKHLRSDFLARLEVGRNNIIDDVLKKHGIYSRHTVQKCVTLYHFHKPVIKLRNDSVRCLDRLKNYPLYIVTDGNKIVQNHKIEALGLREKFKFCFITHRYGIKNAKPSPHCFLKICDLEKTSPQNIVYIGDNPAKDFVGIKPLGFRTVRILQGYHKDERMPAKYEADFEINTLDEYNKELWRAD